MESRSRSAARRGNAAGVLAGVALLAAGLGAQQPQGPPAQPAFRAGADLVIVDTVVVDKDGKPVGNLTAADFVVNDEGRPQAVSLFQTVSTAAIASQPQGATRRFGYSTNVGVEARPTRAFVLFFDDLHLARSPASSTASSRTAIWCRSSRPATRCAGTRGCRRAGRSSSGSCAA